MENLTHFLRLLSENSYLNTQHMQHTFQFAIVTSETAKYIFLTFESTSRNESAFYVRPTHSFISFSV